MNQTFSPQLTQQVITTITGLGCHYAGSEWIGGGVPTWRIYIEGKDYTPVTMAEITAVTKQINAMLDVEMPNPSRYRLEVSSPGLDRRLFTLADYIRFKESQVKIRLHAPVEERRNWVGTIKAVDENAVTLDIEDRLYVFALNNIEKANLIPNF